MEQLVLNYGYTSFHKYKKEAPTHSRILEYTRTSIVEQSVLAPTVQ